MTYEGAQDGKHYWLTPSDVMEELDAEFGFNFDPCPYPVPEGFDGLTAEWGNSNYVNPPFQGPTKWVRKAIEEYRKGNKVVFVFPIDKWIHYMIEAGAEIRNLKDVRWCATEDGQPGKGTGRWIACFVLDPTKPRHKPVTHWPECWREPGHHACAVAEIERLRLVVPDERTDRVFRWHWQHDLKANPLAEGCKDDMILEAVQDGLGTWWARLFTRQQVAARLRDGSLVNHWTAEVRFPNTKNP